MTKLFLIKLLFLFLINLTAYSQSINYVKIAKELLQNNANFSNYDLPILAPKDIWRCGNHDIIINLPTSNNIYGDSVVITWQLDKNVSNKLGNYFITLCTLDEQLSESFLSSKNSFTIYFDKTKLKKESSIILQISYLLPNEKQKQKSNCEGMYFHRLDLVNKNKLNEIYIQQAQLKETQSIVILSFALILHKQNLFIDALNAYQKAYSLSNPKERENYKKVLDAFIQINGF
jgi:hypothetical protein